MTAKGEHSGTFCSAEWLDLSSSTFTFDLQIFQVFNRSLSLMIISLRDHTDSKKTFKPVRFIKLEVLYPPTVTSLSVDEREVNGSCLINENQEVNITCSFDKGNPPGTFRLLVQNGTELKRSDNNGHVVHLMTACCTDDWPIVRCEGDGARQNRSVLFLVRFLVPGTESLIITVVLGGGLVLTVDTDVVVAIYAIKKGKEKKHENCL